MKEQKNEGRGRESRKREEEERVGRGKRKVKKEECLVQEGRERYCTLQQEEGKGL